MREKLLLIIPLIIILNLNAIALAEQPTPEEKALLDNITNRLLNNSIYWPHSVNDTLNSSNPNIGFNITLNCSEGSKVNSVKIIVNTTFEHWNTTKYPEAGNASGLYVWNWSGTVSGPVNNRVKSIVANNSLMINYSALLENENNTLGRLVNEGVLYHELLHGQLLIDAMKSNNTWINDTCNCNFSLGPAGLEENSAAHGQIYSYEGQYVDSVANASGYNLTRKTYQILSHGGFSITINLTDDLNKKENVTYMIYPVTNNVRITNHDSPEYGIFHIEGNITGNSGKIRLIVDPPNIGILSEIYIYEEQTQYEGEPYPLPSLGTYGLIILPIFLVVISILRFKEKI